MNNIDKAVTFAKPLPKLKYQDLLDTFKLLEEQDKKIPVGITFNKDGYDWARKLPESKSNITTFKGIYSSWYGIPIYIKKKQKEFYKIWYNQKELDDYLKE